MLMSFRLRGPTVSTANLYRFQTSASESASVARLAVGESMWIVRVGRYNYGVAPNEPPVEFVQACAPCERRGVEHPGCGYLASHWCNKCGQVVPCPDCRIELVGPCPTCDGEPFDPKVHLGRCPDCDSTLTVTLGHAYAVGQPLPIVAFSPDHEHDFHHICIDERPDSWALRYPGSVEPQHGDDLTDALAHYGPPETLVGHWAIQLRVVGS